MSVVSPLQQGLDFLKAKKLDEAIEALEEATKMSPSDYRAFNYLGIAYAQKGKHNLAIGALQSASHLRPEIASIRYNLGLAYQADGLVDMAKHEFEQAIQLDPSYQKAADALNILEGKLNSDDAFSANSCARHPDEPAVGICSYCRLPMCKACKTMQDGQVYCTNCASKL